MNRIRERAARNVLGGIGFLVLLTAAACSDGDRPAPPTWSNENTAGDDQPKHGGNNGEIVIDTRDEPPGSHCPEGGTAILTGIDRNRNGRLDRSEVSHTEYVCNGDDGADGATSLVETANVPVGNSTCPAGGTSLTIGVDTDGDGTLDASEVSSTRFICNGEDGENGEDGLNGLVSVEPEPSGSPFCIHGGQEIRSGLDRDRDDVLDAGEVQTTEFVCNGAPGAAGPRGEPGYSALVSLSPEPSGANCAAGGSRIDAGLDTDRDGELDAAEVTSTSYACNGRDGGGNALEIVVSAPPCGTIDPSDDVSEVTGNEGEPVEVCVSLSSAPSAPVLLAIETDLDVDPIALTFAANNFNVSQTITIESASDDDLFDTEDELTLNMTPLAAVRTVPVTLTDPDAQRYIVSASAAECEQGVLATEFVIPEGTTKSVWMRLGAPPASPPETIEATADFPELGVSPASFVFTSADWNVCRELTLEARQDGDGVMNSVSFTLSSNFGGAPGIPASPTTTFQALLPDDDKTLAVNLIGASRVTSQPFGINCHPDFPDCAEAYPVGTLVNLEATADPGWVFQNFGGNGCQPNGPTSASVTMTENRTCTATFWPVLTTLPFIGGTVTRSTGPCPGGSCVAPLNEPVTLIATPLVGSRFFGWSGDCTGGPETTVIMNAPKRCTPIFFPNPAPNVIVEPGALVMTESSTATLQISLATPPPSDLWTVQLSATTPAVALGASVLSFGFSNWNVPQTVQVLGVCDLDLFTQTGMITVTPQQAPAVNVPVTVQDIGLCF